MKRLVILESPCSGNYMFNMEYARIAMMDSIARDESPMVGHLLYTQVLDDTDPDEREAGMSCHLAWIAVSDCVVVYQDLGISNGMKEAIKIAKRLAKPIEYRNIIHANS